jgi:hypothetical protein
LKQSALINAPEPASKSHGELSIVSTTGLSDFAPDLPLDEHAQAVLRLLASGGDERITLDSASGLNRYHSGPYPRTITTFASSTANDISRAAFSHVAGLAAEPWGSYAERLERLRGRIRGCFSLADGCRIVFAPSGTDLEFAALAAVVGRARGGIHNILLGTDEVGSGCRYSAHGQFFASITARGIATEAGEPVAGLEQVCMVDVPVRCAEGLARASDAVAADILAEVRVAHAAGRLALIHIVHGSKTGMILPELEEIDRILADAGDSATLVVDACQARITMEALHAYLARGAIVFMTGSKFMGAPPFSGFALVPQQVAEAAGPLPSGLAAVFRRAEWPAGWPGRDRLADEDNPGLWLRLEAAIFELERFQTLELSEIERILHIFQGALEHELLEPLGLAHVTPYPPGREREAGEHPIEMRTLATINVSSLPGTRSFDEAHRLHRLLALSGLRLGQPVRSVRTSEGDWAGTLRIGLSMPQMVEWSRMDDQALGMLLRGAMTDIASALNRDTREKAA